MKKYATTLILALTFPLGELHTFWEKSKPVMQNWIVFRYVPMTIQYNIWYAENELYPILLCTAFLCYKKNRTNDASVKTYICFLFLDMAAYFLNWKTFYYGFIYFLIIILWLIFYHKKKKKLK